MEPPANSGNGDRPDAKMHEEEPEKEPVEADKVYVLMRKDYRLSRNTRARFYLDRLIADSSSPSPPESNQAASGRRRRGFELKRYEMVADLNPEAKLDVVGVVPFRPPSGWDADTAHLHRYHLSPRSNVRYLSQRYRFVFLLDLSPSLAIASNDSRAPRKDSYVSALLPSLKACLVGLVRPFYVPGSQLLLGPDIHVAIVAWTPFLALTKTVLHQGRLVTQNNVRAFVDDVGAKLSILQARIAAISVKVNMDLIARRAREERLMGGLFEDEESAGAAGGAPAGAGGVGNGNVEDGDHDRSRRARSRREAEDSLILTTAPADIGFINMVRLGMLALQLLPGNSSANMVVVTDGAFAPPGLEACDNLLSQLRSKVISLSFLQVSGAYRPQNGLARMPYVEIMEYLAYSTYGSYLPVAPEVRTNDYAYKMNVYHSAFLCWSFRKALEGMTLSTTPLFYELLQPAQIFSAWDGVLGSMAGGARLGLVGRGNKHDQGGIRNGFFEMANRDRFVKLTYEYNVNCSMADLMNCRLREGYTVNNVLVTQQNGLVSLKLTLPWKLSTFVHYIVFSVGAGGPGWSAGALDASSSAADRSSSSAASATRPKCKVQIYLEGDYDTMYGLMNECWENVRSMASEKSSGGPEDDGDVNLEEHSEGGDGEDGGGLEFMSEDSRYRQHGVRARTQRKYRLTLKHLEYVDKLVAHLCQFGSSQAHYNVPDNVRSGVPLFTVSVPNQPGADHHRTDQLQLVQTETTRSYVQFTKFWRPISSLDFNIWHRWLHAHRIHLLLYHDSPLPKHLMMTNMCGKYTAATCRRAHVTLGQALKSWSTFTLVENSIFIRFLRQGDTFDGNDALSSKGLDETSSRGDRKKDDPPKPDSKPQPQQQPAKPTNFIIIRMTARPPCGVVWLAFPGGTDGGLRNKAVQALGRHIKRFTIRQRTDHHHEWNSPGCSAELKEFPACIVMEKPVERVLIRYQSMLSNFDHFLESAYQSVKALQQEPRRNWELDQVRGGGQAEQQQQGSNVNDESLPGMVDPDPAVSGFGTYLTLARYIPHNRWIWKIQASPDIRLRASTVDDMLHALVRARLSQGFHFGHSKFGIQTMVTELPMKPTFSGMYPGHGGGPGAGDAGDGGGCTCVVQYVIFPPIITKPSILPVAASSLSEAGLEAGSSGSSTDDVLEEADSDMPVPEHPTSLANSRVPGECEIVCELWVEPQDGTFDIDEEEDDGDGRHHHGEVDEEKNSKPAVVCRKSGSNQRRKMFAGKSHEDLQEIIWKQDQNILTSLYSAEHLWMACKGDGRPNQCMADAELNDSLLPSCVQSRSTQSRRTMQEVPEDLLDTLDDSKRCVHRIPYTFNLVPLLERSSPSESLFSTFIQGHHKLGHEALDSDSANQNLLKAFADEVRQRVKDRQGREVVLSSRENANLLAFFLRRSEGSVGKVGGLKTRFVRPVSEEVKERKKQESGSESGRHPEWLCFIVPKRSSGSEGDSFLLTLMPKSFYDLKRLIVDEAVLSGSFPGSLRTVSTDQIDDDAQVEDQPGEGEGLVTSEASASASVSDLATDTADMHSRGAARLTSMLAKLAKSRPGGGAGLRKHSGELGSNRSRTISSESGSTSVAAAAGGAEDDSEDVAAAVPFRARCTSIGSFVKGNGPLSAGALSSSDTASAGGARGPDGSCEAMRKRTQTMQVSGPNGRNLQRPVLADILRKRRQQQQQDLQEQKTVSSALVPTPPMPPPPTPITPGKGPQMVWGSVTLPVYTFEVSPGSLAEDLIADPSLSSFDQPDGQTLDHRFEVVDDDDDEVNRDADDEGSSSLCAAHFEDLKLAYCRSFVTVLFKELQQDWRTRAGARRESSAAAAANPHAMVHKLDVKHALNRCALACGRKVSFHVAPELDQFLSQVCHHVRSSSDSEVRQTESEGSAAKTCCEVFKGQHQSIKRKFRDLMSSNFRMVRLADEDDLYYYYCPVLPASTFDPEDRPHCSSSLSAALTGTTATPQQQQQQQQQQVQQQALGLPQQQGRVLAGSSNSHLPTAEVASEMFSMMASSSHDFRKKSLSTLSNAPLSEAGEAAAAAAADPQEVLLPPLFLKMTVSVRTFSAAVHDLPACVLEIDRAKRDKGQQGDDNSSSTHSVFPEGTSLDLVCTYLPVGDKEDDQSFPAEYSEMVKGLVVDVQWIIEDEISFAAMNEEVPTYSRLALVANHVEAFDQKPGCHFEVIALEFLGGGSSWNPAARKVEDMFHRLFPEMEVPGGYQLKQMSSEQMDCPRSVGKNLEHLPEDKEDEVHDDDEDLDLSAEDYDHRLVKREDEEVVLYYLVDTASAKQTFWFVVSLQDNMVKMHVQYREELLAEKLKWRKARDAFVEACEGLCKRVNQSFLLEELYETRTCNVLLVPEGETIYEVLNDSSACEAVNSNSISEQPVEAAAGDAEDLGPPSPSPSAATATATLNFFKPGTFACPKVFESDFTVHPRLMTGSGSRSSRAFHAVRICLESLSVSNRENLFVYQDQMGRIFYMKMLEQVQSKKAIIMMQSTTPSRSGSLTPSTTAAMVAPSEEDGGPIVGSGGCGGSSKIVIKVYGLYPPGDDIRHDFVTMLRNSLDFRVMDYLAMMLQRKNKLGPDDVSFLQKPSTMCHHSMKLALHPELASRHSELMYYLGQNLSTNDLICVPKYLSNEHTFQDYEGDDRVDEDEGPCDLLQRQIYVYHNASKGRVELAVIVIAFLVPTTVEAQVADRDEEHDDDDVEDKGLRLSKDGLEEVAPPDATLEKGSTSLFYRLSSMTDVEGRRIRAGCPLLRIRIWKCGRLNEEGLMAELKRLASVSLLDVVLETAVLSQSVFRDNPGSNEAEACPCTEILSEVYSGAVGRKLLDLGLRLKSSSISKHVVDYPARSGPVKNVSEIMHQLSVAVPDLKPQVHQLTRLHGDRMKSLSRQDRQHPPSDTGDEAGTAVDDDDDDQGGFANGREGTVGIEDCEYEEVDGGGAGEPCTGPIPPARRTEELEDEGREECIIIGRNFKHWEACLLGNDAPVEDLSPRRLRMHQNFQPLYSPEQQRALSAAVSLTSSAQPDLESTTLQASSKNSQSMASLVSAGGTIQLSSSPTGSQLKMSTSMMANEAAAGGSLVSSSGSASATTVLSGFIPRQHLVVCYLEARRLVIYVYNLSKECSERLVRLMDNLGAWHSARVALAQSVVLQKAGLFHCQPFFRPRSKEQQELNTYMGSLKHVKDLSRSSNPPKPSLASPSKHPSEPYGGPQRQHLASMPSYRTMMHRTSTSSVEVTSAGSRKVSSTKSPDGGKQPQNIEEVWDWLYSFRNVETNPNQPRRSKEEVRGIAAELALEDESLDELSKQGKQLLDIRASDSKHIFQTLFQVYEARGLDCAHYFSQDVIDLFLAKGTMWGWAYVPMLLTREWRKLAMDVKNMVVILPQVDNDHVLQNVIARVGGPKESSSSPDRQQQQQPQPEEPKLEPRSQLLLLKSARLRTISNSSSSTTATTRRQAEEKSLLHQQQLQQVSAFWQEYSNYLHMLGFQKVLPALARSKTTARYRISEAAGGAIRISPVETARPRGIVGRGGAGSVDVREKWEPVFMFKVSPGGIILAEVGLMAPFVYVKVRSFELSMLQENVRDVRLLAIQNRGGAHFNVIQEVCKKLQEECQDMISDRLRLEAICYDHHLRTIRNHLTSRACSGKKSLNLMECLDGLVAYFGVGVYAEPDGGGVDNHHPSHTGCLVGKGSVKVDVGGRLNPYHLSDYMANREVKYGFNVLKVDQETICLSRVASYTLTSASSSLILHIDVSSVAGMFVSDNSSAANNGTVKDVAELAMASSSGAAGSSSSSASSRRSSSDASGVRHQGKVVDGVSCDCPDRRIHFKYFVFVSDGGVGAAVLNQLQEGPPEAELGQSRTITVTMKPYVEEGAAGEARPATSSGQKLVVKGHDGVALDLEGPVNITVERGPAFQPRLLDQLVKIHSAATSEMLKRIFDIASHRCRVDELWQKLTRSCSCPSGSGDEASKITKKEFRELMTFVERKDLLSGSISGPSSVESIKALTEELVRADTDFERRGLDLALEGLIDTFAAKNPKNHVVFESEEDEFMDMSCEGVSGVRRRSTIVVFHEDLVNVCTFIKVVDRRIEDGPYCPADRPLYLKVELLIKEPLKVYSAAGVKPLMALPEVLALLREDFVNTACYFMWKRYPFK